MKNNYLIIIIRLLVLLFATSTVLFLVLPGVSGNKTGFYWVNIEYEGNEGAWDIGALGNCQYGTECSSAGQVNPPYWGSIRSLLIFHIVSIFFLTSCFASALSHFPSAPFTMKYGTLVPIFGPLFPCIVMISDIMVAHRLKSEGDVKTVQGVDVYWLGATGFIMSVLWFLAVQYNGYLRRLEAGHNEEVEEVEVERNNIVKRMANAASSWWPWSETGQGTADTGDAEGEAGKRKERKRNKKRGEKGSTIRPHA
ncbi:hypothetical protein C349_04896 [Cryptococcus neoformans var. grubii Br795]|uniref:Uncharacterized protein n=1 Tax=Cryptococcus neoformans Tu259-1 TaxID=1230072 RepID=A0A854Q5C6_CRYNE|nr:hypothetical protein C361_05181 [Cryptococcus neoformans var. grubii Tu259-1]OXG78119.1 hypothetical protein C349_04896 [Cryptococcus neoformans var. grubii Br795]